MINQLIPLHDQEWLANQRVAGKVVAECLSTCKRILEHGANDISGIIIAATCKNIIENSGCTATFLNYKGHGNNPFPSVVCVSVNQQLVHGVPNNVLFKHGDVISIDLGATYKGAIADAATTIIFGGNDKAPKYVEMLNLCKLSLKNAIEAIKPEKRLGVIGWTINNTVKSFPYGLITPYGGHGIDTDIPHAQPFVCNKAQCNEGVRLQPGMSLAIEPMLVHGKSVKTTVDREDHWTVWLDKNCIGIHEEHTIFIGDDGLAEVITKFE